MDRLTHEPVYVISIAARMVDMHPQTLRLYERLGMEPDATVDFEAVETYYREIGE